MTQFNRHTDTKASSLNERYAAHYSAFPITKTTVKKTLLASLLVTSLMAVGCSEAQQDQATQSLGLDEKDVFSLKLGSCFNNPNPSGITEGEESDLITEVPIRECTKEHDNEVFHIFNLEDAATIPTTDAISESVSKECVKAYEVFVGKSYEETKYDMSYLSPSDETWATGDREVACYVYDPDEIKLTTSLKGAKV